MTDSYVTVGVIGPVSSGKTSLMNMMLNGTSGTVSKRRGTMSTTSHRETLDFNADIYAEQIKAIGIRDKELYEKRDNNEALKEDLKNAFENNIVMEQPVDLFDIDRTKAQIQLVDFPGLNDSSTRDLYYKHLEDNFSRLSMIMLIFDINGAMNTSDEMDILKKTVELAKKTNEETGIVQKLYIIANKCDEMTYCEESKTLKFVEEEDKELFDQLSVKVEDIVNSVFPELSFQLVRISAENSFIYNMCGRNLADGKPPTNGLAKKYIDKLGVAEYGKKRHRMTDDEKTKTMRKLTTDDIKKALLESGYTIFQNELTKHLTPQQQYNYLLNNLKLYLNQTVLNVNATRLYKELCTSNRFESEDIESESEDSEKQFVSRLIQICEKHAESLSNFQEGKSSEFTDLIAPLLTKINTAMNSSVTALDDFTPTTSTISDRKKASIERKLFRFLSRLCNVASRVNSIYRFLGYSENETEDVVLLSGSVASDALGLSSLIDHVRNTLASYYAKLVECDIVDFNLIMSLIRTKLPSVDSDYDLSDAVRTLFEKNQTIVDPKTSISHLYAKVVPFLTEMCDAKIVEIDERNNILHSFIIRVYDTIEDISVENVKYVNTVRFVWNYLITTSVSGPTKLEMSQERYQTFSTHIVLLENLLCMNRVRSHELTDFPPVPMNETMEYVCAKWYYPEAFTVHSSNEKKRSSSSGGSNASRVTRSKRSR